MLVFVDESYDRSTDPDPKSTFSAVLIQENRCRALDAKLFELKRHFWKVQQSYDLELKGRLLLSDRALELPKNRDFIEQFIILFKEVGAITFAVVQDGTFPLASQSDRLPSLYRALLWRVNTVMQEKFPEDHAVFFFDGIDHRTNKKIAVSFTNFMLKHRWGQAYRHIIPTCFFCDSEVTPGIQMADVLAYCVNERYKGKRGYIEDYFQQFRNFTFNHQNPDEDFTLWGFQRIRPEAEPAPAIDQPEKNGEPSTGTETKRETGGP